MGNIWNPSIWEVDAGRYSRSVLEYLESVGQAWAKGYMTQSQGREGEGRGGKGKVGEGRGGEARQQPNLQRRGFVNPAFAGP